MILAIAAVSYGIGKYFWSKPKYIVGERFENFSEKLENGDDFELNELKGKLVLVDFWGSWCGPCRRENPGLSRLHEQFANKNFGKDAGLRSFQSLSKTTEINGPELFTLTASIGHIISST